MHFSMGFYKMYIVILYYYKPWAFLRYENKHVMVLDFFYYYSKQKELLEIFFNPIRLQILKKHT